MDLVTLTDYFVASIDTFSARGRLINRIPSIYHLSVSNGVRFETVQYTKVCNFILVV